MPRLIDRPAGKSDQKRNGRVSPEDLRDFAAVHPARRQAEVDQRDVRTEGFRKNEGGRPIVGARAFVTRFSKKLGQDERQIEVILNDKYT